MPRPISETRIHQTDVILEGAGAQGASATEGPPWPNCNSASRRDHPVYPFTDRFPDRLTLRIRYNTHVTGRQTP